MLIYLIFFSKVYYKVYSTRSLTIVRKCLDVLKCWRMFSLQRRHNERDGVSNHHTHDCLLKRLFRRRSKKTSKLRVTGLCAGNSPMTGEFPAQTASNAEKVSIDDVIMYFFYMFIYYYRTLYNTTWLHRHNTSIEQIQAWTKWRHRADDNSKCLSLNVNNVILIRITLVLLSRAQSAPGQVMC